MGMWGDMGSAYILARLGALFCGVRGRGAYFTKLLQVLSFCLEMSNGVVECKRRFVIEGEKE